MVGNPCLLYRDYYMLLACQLGHICSIHWRGRVVSSAKMLQQSRFFLNCLFFNLPRPLLRSGDPSHQRLPLHRKRHRLIL